jgi:glycosyltransferase involved in cell wall biosynthesis
MNKSILLMFHCEQAAGYAISTLEKVFYEAATRAGFSFNCIFFSFIKLNSESSNNVIEIDYNSPFNQVFINRFIKENNIKLVLAFDLNFPCTIIPLLKNAGVAYIISYWGASMSSLNHGLHLILKKIECLLRRNKPDMFIFESEAMRATATHGRGLRRSQTDVIHLGVDTNIFCPDYNNSKYTYEQFGIPRCRKIIFYSGHMEERKGVRVIMRAAIQLVDIERFEDVHFLICGNKNNEAETFLAMLDNAKAKSHVSFAGYRSDISCLMRGSHIGVIASIGWDSFTMSSVEMMASGLPLIVSDLHGLSETTVHEQNGFLFEPGNHFELAKRIKQLVINESLACKFSRASRERVVNEFSKEKQIKLLSQHIESYQ